MDSLRLDGIKIAVFCAERNIRDMYVQIAYDLGQAIADSGATLIYGGRHLGLMGALRAGVLKCNGNIIGVLPAFLDNGNTSNATDPQVIIAPDMHSRKAWMEAHADAFIALPGGIGTLDEVITVLETRLCSQHDKPIILLDPSGHYTHLMAFFRYLIDHNSTSLTNATLPIIAQSPPEAIYVIHKLVSASSAG